MAKFLFVFAFYKQSELEDFNYAGETKFRAVVETRQL